jgi:hypothetical protein
VDKVLLELILTWDLSHLCCCSESLLVPHLAFASSAPGRPTQSLLAQPGIVMVSVCAIIRNLKIGQ